MPTAKKHPSVRARSNTASTAAKLTAGAKKKRRPALPRRHDGWDAMTRAWWADIWASPMSPEWDESDVHNVFILAAIYDDIWRAASSTGRKEAASEFRLQRKDLGLTPYDRRRLEWTIESAEESKDRGRQRRSRATTAPAATGPDPRAALHAVN